MIGSIHLLVGTIIGLSFHQPEAIFVISLLSHYILDFIPHLDPDTFTRGKKSFSKIGRFSLVSDIIVVCLLMVLMIITQSNWPHVLLGAVSAQLPDWLIPLERFTFFHPFKRIHKMVHWDSRLAKYWTWYIASLLSPIVITILCAWLFIAMR